MNPGTTSSENIYTEIEAIADSYALQLPPSLSAHYEVSSCLKYSEQSATCLLRQKDTDRFVLLKTASDPLYVKALIDEKNILEFIHNQEHPAASTFPTVFSMQEFEHVHYYIRSYIQGKTLEELCESGLTKPGIPKNQALDYLIQLAELLDFLHKLTPPIIHRDIKPQNVVVDPDGICHLIDMGISRFYDGEKSSDTVIMGTRITAPPEQFGYRETDTRSDIYSMGVLLHYCITGEYEISEKSLSDLDPVISRIARKATMFDPDSRYQSAGELLSDLTSARYGTHSQSKSKRPVSRWPFRILAGLIAVGLVLTGGMIYNTWHKEAAAIPRENETDVVSENTDSVDSDSQENKNDTGAAGDSAAVSPVYTFHEPLIEQAVRQILNKENVPVTEEDLMQITSLRIMGQQVYSKEDDFVFKGDEPFCHNEDFHSTGLYHQRGTISSLEDISHMPNLISLSLYFQRIRDISPLKDTAIEELGLGYNPLTDLSPLQNNTSLRSLSLPGLNIEDTEVISTLPELHSLNISGTGITSLAGLENCPLEYLGIHLVGLKNPAELSGFTSLSSLDISDFTPDALNALLKVPLKNIRVYNCYGLSLDDLSVLSELRAFYCHSTALIDMQIIDPHLPKLEYLGLSHVRIKDFGWVSLLPSLNYLGLYDCECESYDGFNDLTVFLTVDCSEEERIAIMEQCQSRNLVFLQ